MMPAIVKKLAANDRGAAVIEMAMIAPVFALTVIGIVDMSNAYSRKLGAEQGAQRAIEKIMQTTEMDTVANTLKTEAVCQVNGVNSDNTCKTSPITTSDVTVTYRLECKTTSGTIATVYTTTDVAIHDATDCAVNQKEQRYLEVKVEDKYTPMFPIRFAGFTSADGTYHVSATAGMRTQ
ncbi:MAG TPA: TadE/TadG family type IV pilus assembly protein [Sphingomicrobium sp.]|nr:TadE/TadG family type IV pilus assembly protein [Sphingomicrobium sp.]